MHGIRNFKTNAKAIGAWESLGIACWLPGVEPKVGKGFFEKMRNVINTRENERLHRENVGRMYG